MTDKARKMAQSKGYHLDATGKLTNGEKYNLDQTTMSHAPNCRLGEGQNAEIQLAQDLKTGEWVVVKIYDKSRQKASYHVDNLAQIEIEQKVLNILGMNRGMKRINENKLHVYMQFVDGIDLEKATANDIGGFTNALHYANLAVQELSKLHNANFIHADLHPGNIMVCPKTKEVKFVDFEKCMYMNPATKDLEVWGKPPFLPKRTYEKARSKNGGDPIIVPVNKETDRYGLGFSLYTLFAKVLGKDAITMDNDGNIQLKQKPNGITEACYQQLKQALRMLTQPVQNGGCEDLQKIAQLFEQIKAEHVLSKSSVEKKKPSVLPLMQAQKLKSKQPSAQKSHHQIIGTQAIGANYHFTKDDIVVEQAKRMLEMGSDMIKFDVKDQEQLNKLLAMPFSTYFMWWRSGSKKCNMTQADKKAEYEATYNFVKNLLLKNANQEKTFYLGHWEGDWYLLPDYDPTKNPSPERIQGMIDWLNVRQQAVDDARRDFGSKSLSKVYHYTEVNRVRDAMEGKKNRLVNTVLPKTNVDFVSYSSYDVQNDSQETINATLGYIEGKLPKKSGLTGPRVFIGEFGVPAKDVNYDPVKHEEVNRNIMRKFLKSGVPYILYWQMYNNEVHLGKQVGFWLVDDKNHKQPLYHTLEGLYKAQKDFKETRKESIEWLEKMNYKPEHVKKSIKMS